MTRPSILDDPEVEAEILRLIKVRKQINETRSAKELQAAREKDLESVLDRGRDDALVFVDELLQRLQDL